MTHQPVVRLETRDVLHLLPIYPQLAQCYVCKQGQDHRRCWHGGQAFVPWELRVMGPEGETDLALDHAGDQQAEHGQPGSRRQPCGLLQPYGGDRRGMLAPPQTRFHGGILVLIGLKNLSIRAVLRADRSGQHRPPLVLFSLGQGLNLDHQTLACRERRGGSLCGASPAAAARAAGVCHAARADGVRPPGTGPAPSASRPLALIRGESRFGIGPAGKPPSVPMPHVVCQGCGFLLLGSGRGLGVLLRPLTRMHHHKAPFLLGDAPLAVCDLPLSTHTWAMPAAWCCGLRPARLLHQEREDRRRLSPCCPCLPPGTGARDERDEIALMLATDTQGTATLGLPLC